MSSYRLTVTGAGNTSIASPISGSGSLVKSGTGTLTLSGNNTYTGSTLLTAGTLLISSTSALGSQGINGLNFTGGTFGFTSGSNTLSRNFSLNTGSGFTAVNAADLLTLSGTLSGSGSLTTSGAGTVTLTGTNTYTGGTTVASGTLQVGIRNTGTSSSLGTGSVSVDRGGTLYFYAASSAGSATIENRGVTNLFDTVTAGSATINNTGGFYLSDSSTAGTATVNNNGGMTLYSTSSLGSAVVNNNGSLAFYGDATADNGTVINNAGGSVNFDFLNDKISIGALSGSGDIYLSGKAITVGNLNTSTTIAGIIHGGLNGISSSQTGSLIKTGTGTLTLTGVNTYTSSTTVNGGTLLVSSLSALGNQGTGGLILSGGAFGFVSGTNTLTSNISLTGTSSGLTSISASDSLTVSGNVSGSGSLTTSGLGAITLTGTNTHTGGTTVNGKTLNVGIQNTNTSSSLGTGNVTVNAGNSLNFNASSSAGSATINSSGSLSFNDTATADNATLVNNGTLNLNNHTGSLGVGALSGNGAVNLGSNTLTIGNLNTSTALSGVISGSGSLAKTGTGTLTLTGSNTYTGGTTVNSGALAGGSNNALGTGALILASGTTLAATTPVVLNNAVTFGSTANLSSGTFTTGNVHTPGLGLAGAVTLSGDANSTALAVTGTSRVGITGKIGEASNNPQTLIKRGSGTLELGNDNTYTGGTLVAQGTLVVNNAYNRTATGSGTGEGAVTVARGATLTGTYVIGGPVQINNGGRLAVGNSIGTSTVSFLSLAGGATLDFEIGADSISSDRLNIDNLLSRTGSGSILFLLSGEHLADGSVNAVSSGTFTLLTFGSESGFSNSDFVATGLSPDWSATFALTNQGSGPGALTVTLNQNVTSAAAPEPGTLCFLLISGVGTIALTGMRRFAQARAND